MTGGSALINRLSRANFVFVSIPLRFPSALRATKSGWQIFYIYIYIRREFERLRGQKSSQL